MYELPHELKIIITQQELTRNKNYMNEFNDIGEDTGWAFDCITGAISMVQVVHWM